MIIILCVLFVFLTGACFIPRHDKIYKEFFYIFGVIFFTIAAFRGAGVDRDYLNYLKLYIDFDKLTLYKVEPSFIFLVWLVKTIFLNEAIFIYILYALIGITIKLYAIKQLSEFWLLSLLVYLSYSFILHEMTQIRVGIAAAFILLCIKPLFDRNLALFLVFALLAFLFHYSAIFVFLLWFINPQNINPRLYGSFIIVSFALSYLNFNFSNLIDLIPLDVIHNKILAYKYQQGDEINVLNAWQLMRCFLSFILLWKKDIIQQYNRYGVLLIKIYVFSTCSLFLLSDIPVFANRTSDMLGIVDIIVLPFILYILEPKVLAKILVICISFTYLFLNLFYNKTIM